MNDWVVIFETGQLYRAELVKSLLNDNNVEAVILNQKDSSFKIGAIVGGWSTISKRIINI